MNVAVDFSGIGQGWACEGWGGSGGTSFSDENPLSPGWRWEKQRPLGGGGFGGSHGHALHSVGNCLLALIALSWTHVGAQRGCPPPQDGNRGHQRALCLSPPTEAGSSTKGVPRPPLRSGPVPLTTGKENTQRSVGNEIYWKLLSHIQYWFGGYIRRRLHNIRQVEGLGGGCAGTCVRCACAGLGACPKW